jgi:hypothetical protein
VPDEHSKKFFPKTFFPDNKLPPPVNFSKFFLQLLLFNKLCKMFCSITYFWPDKRVVEIVKLARRNCNIIMLVRGCLTPQNHPLPPPTSFGPETNTCYVPQSIKWSSVSQNFWNFVSYLFFLIVGGLTFVPFSLSVSSSSKSSSELLWHYSKSFRLVLNLHFRFRFYSNIFNDKTSASTLCNTAETNEEN